MVTEVRHEPSLGQYELVVGGETVSVLAYERRDDTVVLSHTATEPQHRSRGHGRALAVAVLPTSTGRACAPSSGARSCGGSWHTTSPREAGGAFGAVTADKL